MLAEVQCVAVVMAEGQRVYVWALNLMVWKKSALQWSVGSWNKSQGRSLGLGADRTWTWSAGLAVGEHRNIDKGRNPHRAPRVFPLHLAEGVEVERHA